MNCSKCHRNPVDNAVPICETCLASTGRDYPIGQMQEEGIAQLTQDLGALKTGEALENGSDGSDEGSGESNGKNGCSEGSDGSDEETEGSDGSDGGSDGSDEGSDASDEESERSADEGSDAPYDQPVDPRPHQPIHFDYDEPDFFDLEYGSEADDMRYQAAMEDDGYYNAFWQTITELVQKRRKLTVQVVPDSPREDPHVTVLNFLKRKGYPTGRIPKNPNVQ